MINQRFHRRVWASIWPVDAFKVLPPRGWGVIPVIQEIIDPSIAASWCWPVATVSLTDLWPQFIASGLTWLVFKSSLDGFTLINMQERHSFSFQIINHPAVFYDSVQFSCCIREAKWGQWGQRDQTTLSYEVVHYKSLSSSLCSKSKRNRAFVCSICHLQAIFSNLNMKLLLENRICSCSKVYQAGLSFISWLIYR